MPNFHISLESKELASAKHRKDISELELRELDGKSAIENVQAIIAIFAFLSLIDIGKYFTPKEHSPFGTDEITFQFEYLGELGMALANNCYTNIGECLEGYRQLMEEREESE